MNRRQFIGGLAAAGLLRTGFAEPYSVHFRKPSPHEALTPYILPGTDEFPEEKAAMEIVSALQRLTETRSLPFAPNFRGTSPFPSRYRPVSSDAFEAEFVSEGTSFESGFSQWLASLGSVRATRYFVLPEGMIRYEIASRQGDKNVLEYRVGYWKQTWDQGKLSEWHPVRETLVKASRPLFRDVTTEMFGDCESFQEQMLRGVPYWRARLDLASGIDIYGNNGIAVGDIDGDGVDEVYVCQPGGLPNRLYKQRGGRFVDVTQHAGVGVLDDTSSALFLDLRNSGRQDLVVLRAAGPLLFLNQGDGTFVVRQDAFRFAAPAEGSFTGMSAADYDRDGRIDLYLCTYTYFQSEDQYRYPAPYHDAQNGPPNFLFRNRLAADGSGTFEDVTEAAGMNENNHRFSFAPAWCDFNGDGWPDLYVANDFGRNNLYQNREGHFRDVAREAGVEDIGPGMSAAWFDYDGDGRSDLYVANMWTDAGQRIIRHPAFRPAHDPDSRDAYRRHTKGNSLYRNRGDGTFTETDAAEGVEMGRWAWGADGHDFDNDGSPELYVTCGMLTGDREPDLTSFFWRQVVSKSPSGSERSEAYENGWNAINQFIREGYSWNGNEPNVFHVRRDGHFYDFSGVSGLDCALDSRAFSVTDLDGDGNLDILLKSRLGPQIKAFRNDCAGGRKSLAIRLTGVRSNRDAIGARVEVDGKVRVLQAGCGNVSQHTKVLHFGLNEANEAAHVRVIWPSGEIQEFHHLPAGIRYEITEGSKEIKKQTFAPRRAPKETVRAPLNVDNRPRTHDTWLLDPVPLPDKRRGPGVLYIGGGERPNLSRDVEVIDLNREPAEVAAIYALFRRYLLDWRTSLELPLLLLVDDANRIHKLYRTTPDAATVAGDLKHLGSNDRQSLALPFAGDYVARPRRNYFKLGAAFYGAGYPEAALLYLGETIRQSPNNEKALNALGQIHLEAGRLPAARSYLESAVSVNPRLGEAWNNLGGVESVAGNLQSALQHYERAMALLPGAAYPLVNAGEVKAQLGDVSAAEGLFLQAIKIDPGNSDAPNQLGLLAARTGHNKEAKDWFQKAIALRRDDSGAINNLAVLYLQMGQSEDAIAAFEYGIRVAPDDEQLYMNLGRTYINLGDRAKARGVMLRLLKRKPSSAAATNALRELEVK